MSIHRARQPKADAIAAPHSPVPEEPRQLVGLALQLAIGHPFVPTGEGDLVSGDVSLVLEYFLQQLRTQQVRVRRVMDELCGRGVYSISTCGRLSKEAIWRTTGWTWLTPSAQ
jgi:hypothetical protein